jgi:hypothetical protein
MISTSENMLASCEQRSPGVILTFYVVIRLPSLKLIFYEQCSWTGRVGDSFTMFGTSNG